MEKLVNEIYSECEEKLNSYQIDILVSNLESLSEMKYWKEIKKEWFEETPSEQVSRENCESIL